MAWEAGERAIFTYTLGGRTVKADPMMLDFALEEAGEKVDMESILARVYGRQEWFQDFLRGGEQDPKFLAAKVPEKTLKYALREQREGIREFVPILCKVFKVAYIDEDQESGVTAGELINAYNAWIEFKVGVKKNTETTPSTPPSSDGPGPRLPTENGSDSTTTSTSRWESVLSKFPPESGTGDSTS